MGQKPAGDGLEYVIFIRLNDNNAYHTISSCICLCCCILIQFRSDKYLVAPDWHVLGKCVWGVEVRICDSVVLHRKIWFCWTNSTNEDKEMIPWNFRRNCHCEFKTIPLLNWKRCKCHSVRAIFAASLTICKNTMLTCILFWWMSFVQSNGAYGCCQFTGASMISIYLDWYHWVEIFVNSIQQYIWAVLSTEGWDSTVCIQERWPPTALIPGPSWILYMQSFIIWSVLIISFVTEDSSRELLLLLIYQQFQIIQMPLYLLLLCRLTLRKYLLSLYFSRQCHIDWTRALGTLTMTRYSFRFSLTGISALMSDQN